MARLRGEGQWVAKELNLRSDPKVLGIAQRLRVHRLHATALVLYWREFVLTRGDGNGVVRGYSSAELAMFLDWTRAPATVIEALKGAGFLRTRRGQFIHPAWEETITGHYAHTRSTERDRKAEERELRRRWSDSRPGDQWPGVEEARELLAGQSADSPRTGAGPSAPDPRTNGHKAIKTDPPAPRRGGEGEADALWEWYWGSYPKARNPKGTRRLLDALTDDDVGQLRYGLAVHLPLYKKRKNTGGWRFVPYSDSYLQDGIFWEHRPPKIRAPDVNGAREAKLLADQLDEDARREQERRRLQVRAAVIQQLREAGESIRRGDAAWETRVDALVEERIAAEPNVEPAQELAS